MFGTKERHATSSFTQHIYKESEYVKGQRVIVGETLVCPRCENVLAVTHTKFGDFKEKKYKCKKCGLHMALGVGNDCEIWD